MIITEQVGGGRILTDGKYLLGRVYPPLPGEGWWMILISRAISIDLTSIGSGDDWNIYEFRLIVSRFPERIRFAV